MPIQYLTLYSVTMTYNLKKSIIQWEYVCICICLHPRHGSLSKQCVVLYKLAISSSNIVENFDSLFKNSQGISSVDGIDNCVKSFF